MLFAYGVVKQVNNVRQLEDLALLRFEIGLQRCFCSFWLSDMSTSQRRRDWPCLPRLEDFSEWRPGLHLGMYAGLASIAVTGLLIALLFWWASGTVC